MRNNTLNIAIAFFMAAVMSSVMMSCKKEQNKPMVQPVEPVITIVDSIPTSILPAEIYNEVASKMSIYKGDTPPALNGQFLSQRHALLYASYDPSYNPEDSTKFFYDRYVAFVYSGAEHDGLDFYGKQLDDNIPDAQGNYPGYYEEHWKASITGEGDNFCCYYTLEGQPNGKYLKQSTIFSGTLTSEGIRNFKVAVIMLENSGDPAYPTKNTYRILGDHDGLAEKYNWISKEEPKKHDGEQSDSFIKK